MIWKRMGYEAQCFNEVTNEGRSMLGSCRMGYARFLDFT